MFHPHKRHKNCCSNIDSWMLTVAVAEGRKHEWALIKRDINYVNCVINSIICPDFFSCCYVQNSSDWKLSVLMSQGWNCYRKKIIQFSEYSFIFCWTIFFYSNCLIYNSLKWGHGRNKKKPNQTTNSWLISDNFYLYQKQKLTREKIHRGYSLSYQNLNIDFSSISSAWSIELSLKFLSHSPK